MSPESFTSELTKWLLGASYSVDIMCSTRSGWTFPVSLADITALCNRQLDLRYLVRESQESDEKSIDLSLRSVAGKEWKIRCSYPDKATGNCIIIDRECAFLMSVGDTSYGIQHALDPIRIGQVSGRFQRLWDGARDANRLHFSFESNLDYMAEPEVTRISTFVAGVWDDLIRRLALHPGDLHTLHPRKFEELIAELLQRDGFTTEVTRITRDGGRDILAWLETKIGRHLFLVECKRYSSDRPVDVSIVRELYGVIAAERATGGLIATTSNFTRDAQAFQKTLQYQLGMKDFNGIQDWLRRTAGLL